MTNRPHGQVGKAYVATFRAIFIGLLVIGGLAWAAFEAKTSPNGLMPMWWW